MKNVKTTGQDNMNAELFIADPEIAASIWTHVFTAVWQIIVRRMTYATDDRCY